MSKFCFCIPGTCDTCYEYSIPFCPGSLVNIPCTNLVPYYVTYYLWIRDKFGNLWQDTVTGNSDGSFTITLSDFPSGMFTPAFGPMDVFLTTDDMGTIAQVMYFNLEEFNCVILNVDGPIYLMDDSGCNYLTDDNGNALISG
jgi:hypothetical protein